MFFFKSNKLASIKASLAPPAALFCEYLKNLNRDPLLKYFPINSEFNLLSTLEIALYKVHHTVLINHFHYHNYY